MTPSEREEIRSEICEIISQMLDNPDDVGIYPTTRCFNRLENLILTQVEKARACAIEECAKIVKDRADSWLFGVNKITNELKLEVEFLYKQIRNKLEKDKS